MYRIAVCEDDPRTAEQNKTAACRVLEGKGHVQGRDYDIDVFHTAPPLIERLAGDPDAYQLLLLDIQLDGDNGVELARFLREHQVGASIIYITDHPGFALDSFPTYPLEYLLKPVDEARLAAALDWDWRQRHIQQKRPVLRVGGRLIPLDAVQSAPRGAGGAGHPDTGHRRIHSRQPPVLSRPYGPLCGISEMKTPLHPTRKQRSFSMILSQAAAGRYWRKRSPRRLSGPAHCDTSGRWPGRT